MLARLDQRDRHALASRPPRAPDAMHIGIGVGRHVVVHDVADVLDVEAARGDVRRDEHVQRAVAEAAHDPVAGLLGEAAMQRAGVVATAAERLGQVVHLAACPGEDERGRRILDVEDAAQRGQLVDPPHDVRGLAHAGDAVAGRLLGVDRDPGGLAQVALGDPRDRRGDGRREERGLALCRGGRQDRVEVLGEAHVEHLVGLVEHDDPRRIEAQAAALEVVDRSTRRGDDDVDPATQAAQLLPDRLAAVDGHDPGAERLAVDVEGLGDLHRELAGRDDHERAGRVGAGLPDRDALEDRQGERRGLAGAGRRLGQDVPPGRAAAGWPRAGWASAPRSPGRRPWSRSRSSSSNAAKPSAAGSAGSAGGGASLVAGTVLRRGAALGIDPIVGANRGLATPWRPHHHSTPPMRGRSAVWWLTTVAAFYPAAIVILLVSLPVLAPRSGPLALAAVLAMHLALAAIVLVPLVFLRDARPLRVALIALAVISLSRFGSEWVSIPPVRATDSTGELAILSWNLELGARAGEAAVDGLRGIDADVVALQELGPDHAAAIEADPELRTRFPYRELAPREGVEGMGLLSAYPIVRSALLTDPMAIEAVLDVDGRPLTSSAATRSRAGSAWPGRCRSASTPAPGTSRWCGSVPGSMRPSPGAKRSSSPATSTPPRPSPRSNSSWPVWPMRTPRSAWDRAGRGDQAGWNAWVSASSGSYLAFSGPGARPIAVGERLTCPVDHCRLEARSALD